MPNKLYQKWKTVRHHRFIEWMIGAVFLISCFYVCVPKPNLYEHYGFSSAVFDRHDKLLNLSLSIDDKYRLFTPLTEISPDAVKALLLYEDRAFYYHFGINPLSIFRACLEMIKGGRRQGASTITMQLARLIYHLDTSTVGGKIQQILRALQIEMFYDKNEILQAYFNLAPYGGNIEGIGAASHIYFNKKPQDLHLKEILALTVIPQNPAKRHLMSVQNRQNAQTAAHRLEKTWRETYPDNEQNDRLDLTLSSGIYLPKNAPHFVRQVSHNHYGYIQTGLDLNFQHMAEETLQQYVDNHRRKGVHNAAAIIVDARDMQILAYVGSKDFFDKDISGQVDGTKAMRSPGSALKPFIYAKALEKGLIHPKSMLKDVPRNYGAYAPENFDRSYYGIINATEALIRSRNIPAVDLLLKIGESDFHQFLTDCDVKNLQSPDFYGLSLALGGAEVSMQNLAAMYAVLYNQGIYSPLRFTKDSDKTQKVVLSPEAAFLTLQMLSEQPDPELEQSPYAFEHKLLPIAWKTGTSYSYKDAWTAGIVGPYVIVVWIGNFDGTPNPAFVGRQIAAPLFFRLARKLIKEIHSPEILAPTTHLNLSKVKICAETGDIADEYCDKKDETYFIPGVTSIKLSNVTRLIPIYKKSGLRACRHTPPLTEMRSYNFWSSDILKAYADAGIRIKRPPDFEHDCPQIETSHFGQAPKIVLPTEGSHFYLRLSQKEKATIALKAVVDPDVEQIYWFVNNKLSGQSKAGDILEIRPPSGKIEIKAIDDRGRSSVSSIYISWIN